jgi:hypothetical protein
MIKNMGWNGDKKALTKFRNLSKTKAKVELAIIDASVVLYGQSGADAAIRKHGHKFLAHVLRDLSNKTHEAYAKTRKR